MTSGGQVVLATGATRGMELATARAFAASAASVGEQLIRTMNVVLPLEPLWQLGRPETAAQKRAMLKVVDRISAPSLAFEWYHRLRSRLVANGMDSCEMLCVCWQ